MKPNLPILLLACLCGCEKTQSTYITQDQKGPSGIEFEKVDTTDFIKQTNFGNVVSNSNTTAPTNTTRFFHGHPYEASSKAYPAGNYYMVQHWYANRVVQLAYGPESESLVLTETNVQRIVSYPYRATAVGRYIKNGGVDFK